MNLYMEQATKTAPSSPEPAKDNVFVFPVTFAQQRLWFLDQLQPGSLSYLVPWSMRISGKLDAAALERSLNEIVRRHEVLRTTFASQDEQPVQMVRASLRVPLPLVDVSDHGSSERAQQIVLEEAQTPIDLTEGPMVRARLVRVAPEEHILLVTMHHIVFDGWSRRIFVRELAALYEAFCAARPSPLPELPLQYADFAVWQRKHLQGKNFEKQLTYWKRQLADAPATLELPSDRPRPPVQSYKGAISTLVLPPALGDKLNSVARERGATLFMALLAGFQLLLARYSGQEDIVIGTPIASRNRPEIEGLIGLFANTLVLRTHVAGGLNFAQLLDRVKDTALGAYANQDVPFERLVEDLQPERSLSHNPLFQVLFSLQNAPRQAFELAGLKVRPMDSTNAAAKFDLSLFLVENPEGIRGRMEYNTDLFDQATIERMLRHFQGLLEAAVSNPHLPIAELPLVTGDERQQLIAEWNSTKFDYPRHLCLQELFEKQAERAPEAVACVHCEEQISYGELNRRANQLAHYLKERGIGPGQRVGIFVERSLAMMVGLLGIQKSGAAYVPLDPGYPAERLRLIVDDAQLPVIVTQESLTASLPPHAAEVICLDRDWNQIASRPVDNPRSGVTPEDLVYVIFTSGSTGRPKGVQVPHRAVVNLLSFMAQELRMTEQDVFPALASFAFDMCIPELYLALVTGGRVVIGDRHLAANGEELAALLRKTGATVVHATPTTWNLLLDAGFSGKGLKRVIGAEPLPKDLCRRLLEADASLYNFYGPTETTVWSTFHHFRSPDEPVVVGRPLANTQVYILDKNLQPVPVGVAGEIHIAGDGVTCGYLNRPELTAEKFIADPFAKRAGAKMYKTGDLGRFLADGRIEFQGRVDNQVKVRGYRIELGEIEAALGKHAGVKECAVIVREDVPGDKRLVAYFVTANDSRPDTANLRAWMKERLPDYMVPVTFVAMERLPLSPNGKVNRKALPAPDYAVAVSDDLPCTSTQELIASVWKEVLRNPAIGVHDNFFEVGGHSLSATRVISRIQKAFKVDVPLRTIFERPTISQLAEAVEMTQQLAVPSQTPELTLLPRDAVKSFPLSFGQQRLWVLDRLQPNTAAYNIPIVFRVSGRLNIDALQRAFQQIMERHEALRTRFVQVNGEPQQVIDATAVMPLDPKDVRKLPQQERECHALDLARDEITRPFDLRRGPMMRARVIRLDEDVYVVAIAVHHIAFDAWSAGILMRELESLYSSYCEHKAPALPELAVQYADFAAWQRAALEGENLERRIAYWKEKFANLPTGVDLPTDHARPSVQSFRGETRSVMIPAAVLKQLHDLSRNEGVTLFMTLLAAFNILLARYSRQEDIVVGSPIAGRQRAEVEQLIGLFVNTLVLRNDLSGNPSFRELLERVRLTAMDAYAHDVPFEKLVEELRPERDLSRNPLFQIMFILQNMPREAHRLANVAITPVRVSSGTEKFDLSVIAVEREEGLSLSFGFATDLFERETIEGMSRHFQRLLEEVVRDPEKHIAEFDLLSESERQELLVTWNSTAAEYSRDATVHELIQRQAAQSPKSVAVTDGSQSLTYEELNARANQLAHYLRKRGVGPEVLVGICLERSVEMVVALLGVMKAGGAYVPLDPAFPKERIGFIIEDAKAPVLLTQASLVATLPEHSAEIVQLDAEWQAIAAESSADVAASASPQNLAYVLYTSGSTGKPKGVQVEHGNVVNFLESMARQPGIAAEDTLLAVTTLSFDIAGLELFLPLTVGAKIVLASREQALDGKQLIKLVDELGVTIMQATPATWRLMMESGWQGSQLKVLCGGEALPPDLAQALLPRCRELWNMYGPTETTIWSSVFKVDAKLALTAPIGRPIANTTMYILDGECKPVPVGVAGELYIGGAGVARGYLNRPELTKEKFVDDPFNPGARMYRTGDLAKYLRDGNIVFLGRADFQVKVRGFRIELGEIETVLGRHSEVQQGVVVVREDAPGDKRLVGYYVANGNADPGPAALRDHVKQTLPDYMVPSMFVRLEQLPLTPNGKINRRALPRPDASQLVTSRVAPRDELEQKLVEIWEKVLGIPEIGITDDFFELGGHSLLAARLVAEASHVAGREVPLSALFRGATVESLADVIRHDWASEPDPVALCIRSGSGELAFFAVASPGVDTLGYALLARQLGDQTVYKLQTEGPVAGNRPYSDEELKELSRRYIGAMRAVQPHGPYCFIGMCEGVQIAQQMIVDLEAEGEEIGFFAILDTWVLQNSQVEWRWRLDYYRQRLRSFRRAPGKLPSVTKSLGRQLRTVVTSGKLDANAEWHRAYWPGKDFKAPRFQAPIVLFKRPKQPFYYVDDPKMGWGERSMTSVEVHTIDFRHVEMLREPYVKTIGEVLLSHLRRLEAQRRPSSANHQSEMAASQRMA